MDDVYDKIENVAEKIKTDLINEGRRKQYCYMHLVQQVRQEYLEYYLMKKIMRVSVLILFLRIYLAGIMKILC